VKHDTTHKQLKIAFIFGRGKSEISLKFALRMTALQTLNTGFGVYEYIPFFYGGFVVFMAVTMKNVVFWDVTRRGFCKNRCFAGTYRFHYQDEKSTC
jgi:hypothetical protein